jgi:hypothetical protein
MSDSDMMSLKKTPDIDEIPKNNKMRNQENSP